MRRRQYNDSLQAASYGLMGAALILLLIIINKMLQ